MRPVAAAVAIHQRRLSPETTKKQDEVTEAESTLEFCLCQPGIAPENRIPRAISTPLDYAAVDLGGVSWISRSCLIFSARVRQSAVVRAVIPIPKKRNGQRGEACNGTVSAGLTPACENRLPDLPLGAWSTSTWIGTQSGSGFGLAPLMRSHNMNTTSTS